MKNFYKIILSLTILSLLSVGWGQVGNNKNDCEMHGGIFLSGNSSYDGVCVGLSDENYR